MPLIQAVLDCAARYNFTYVCMLQCLLLAMMYCSKSRAAALFL